MSQVESHPPYFVLKPLITAFRGLIYTDIWAREKFTHVTDYIRFLGSWTKEYTIPSSAGGVPIVLRVWEAPDQSAGPRPVHLNFHGSGYAVDLQGQDSHFCALMSKTLNITIFDCNYSKAPEFPFPYAYHDGIDVLKHVVSLQGTNGPKYDLDNITIGGFSAGSGLAFSIAATDEEWGKRYIKAILGVYPFLNINDYPEPPPAGPPGSTGIRLNWTHFWLFKNCYAQAPYSAKDPRISPSFLKDEELGTIFKGRKVCMITCGEDNLGPHAVEFYERLAKAGVEADHKLIPEVGHGWVTSNAPQGWEADRKAEAYEFITKWFKDVYATTRPVPAK